MHVRSTLLSGCAGVLALLMGGCATTSVAPEASPGVVAPGEGLSFRLEGSRIIACCCSSPCPCRLNEKPMHCHGCDFTTAVHIDRGEINGVDVSGLDWVFTGRGFSEDPGTNWHYVYISDRATPEQLAAIQTLLTESVRPLEPKKEHLLGRAAGMRQAPIRWSRSRDGKEWGCAIPGVLDVQTRALVVPGRDHAATSTGIFDDYGDGFTHAECLKHTYNDPEAGYKWNLTGRQCNQADFTLSSDGPVTALGWGCWSAHSTLGHKGEYQERLIGHD